MKAAAVSCKSGKERERRKNGIGDTNGEYVFVYMRV